MRVMLALVALVVCASALQSELTLQDESRPYFVVSSFGLLQGGSITLQLKDVCKKTLSVFCNLTYAS